ncbi:hypothetical protein JOC94_002347 [Bacillus thermophilus]|uniref:Uncharacterized protein n=1 Tax=Siminovitchia thermophila TaxID=1245522 RepID=A0ABS2R6S1_9BACI|nr:hypothetical protein [Siminovitchia thermophila]MBM7715360.1 hypothetical protein [Siminovitchia thermophila]
MKENLKEYAAKERVKLLEAGVIVGDIPEGHLIYKATYKYLSPPPEKKTFTGNMVVQVWHEASVEQLIKDRLYTERGWNKGWIFVDSIQFIGEMDIQEKDFKVD